MALNGFDSGLQAEKIVTMVEEEGEYLIGVKFKGRGRTEMLPAYVVKREIPLMVIEFFVKNMRYDPGQKEQEELMRVRKQEKEAKRKAKAKKERRQRKKEEGQNEKRRLDK